MSVVEMFTDENTHGFYEDEIEQMNEKLIFRCAKNNISPIGRENRDGDKDLYDEICEKILEEVF